MNKLKALFGHDDKFFELLEASAAEASGSVQLLMNMMSKGEAGPSLEDFVLARRRDKKITEEITEELCRTFVTPLEREDIEQLSVALYKIPKTVEKFTERYLICRNHLKGCDFSGQLKILDQAAETVAAMVEMIRKHPGLSAVKEHNDRLHLLESEADRLLMTLMKDLYSGNHDALKVIVILDLHDMLERIIDRCRDAGNVIFQIVLKYS